MENCSDKNEAGISTVYMAKLSDFEFINLEGKAILKPTAELHEIDQKDSDPDYIKNGIEFTLKLKHPASGTSDSVTTSKPDK